MVFPNRLRFRHAYKLWHLDRCDDECVDGRWSDESAHHARAHQPSEPCAVARAFSAL